MSRIPPLPSESRRPRTPSVSDNGASTRPLQINRPPRPTTPSGSSVPPATGSPRGPTRPTRSGLRSRQVSEVSATDRSSMESRATRDSRETYDGRPTGLPDGPQSSRSRNFPMNGSDRPNGRTQTPLSPQSPELSPTSLAAVAAFQSFGRRRGMSNDDMMDAEYEEQKRREIELLKARQKRIREKVPGRRTTGKAKAGDIDGKSPMSPDDVTARRQVYGSRVGPGVLKACFSCFG